MTYKLSLLVGAAGLCAGLVNAAETGYTLRLIDLKAKPYLDADTLIKLPEKTELEIVTRNGPWMLVKTKAKRTGYVRLLQVRLSVSATGANTGGWLPPAGIETSSRTTTAAVTTGVRGFSEEDLKRAQPNKAEYDKMKSYAANAQQAATFAAQALLSARSIAYYSEDGKPLPGGKK